MINSNMYYSYYQKGDILRTFLKDSKTAVRVLDEAIRINPNYVEAYNTRGYALMDLGIRMQQILLTKSYKLINKKDSNNKLPLMRKP